MDNKIANIINIIKEELDYADAKVKKEINERFNLSGSKKIKEIEHELLGIANEYRKSKKDNFTDNDFYVWNKYWDYPSSKTKIAEAIKDESNEWIEFVLSKFKIIYDKSVGKISKDKRYFHLLKIKMENSDSYKKEQEKIENIYEKLTILTFSFKEKMYNRFINSEKSSFENLNKIKEQMENDKEYRQNIFKNEPKLYSRYIRVKSYSRNFDWNFYKNEYLNREFENLFSHNIMGIAQRLSKNSDIDIDSLKLIKITEDPTFFEIILRDKNNFNIHCRSIIAAEFSDLMQTHYRFLTTIKKPKK